MRNFNIQVVDNGFIVADYDNLTGGSGGSKAFVGKIAAADACVYLYSRLVAPQPCANQEAVRPTHDTAQEGAGLGHASDAMRSKAQTERSSISAGDADNTPFAQIDAGLHQLLAGFDRLFAGR